MILFINIIAEGGGVVVKERTKKRPLLGPRFLIKKTHRATAVVFYIAHIHTHTLYVHNG